MDTQVDVAILDQGSLVGFRPLTDAAKTFIAENVQAESWQWLGRTLMVEHRFADNLIAGMQADGLVVEA